MQVRIFQPAKTAMQSGRGKAKKWVLEFEPASKKETDQLMGWIGSGDMRGQVRLTFDSKAEALAFATKNGHTAVVSEPKERKLQIKAYADNFAFSRVT